MVGSWCFLTMKSMNLTKYSFPSRLLSPLLGLILVEILSDTWYVVYMVWTSRWFSDYLIAKQDDSEMIDANQKVNFPCSPQCGLRLWSKMHHCPVIHVLRIQQFLSLFEGIPHVDVPKRFMARAFNRQMNRSRSAQSTIQYISWLINPPKKNRISTRNVHGFVFTL